MLIAPGFVAEGGGIDWSNVTASSLLGLEPAANVVEGQGVPELSGAVIHLGVRRARPGARSSGFTECFAWISPVTCMGLSFLIFSFPLAGL